MKNSIIKVLTIFGFLNFTSLMSMELVDMEITPTLSSSQELYSIAELPHELWAQIIYFTYFNSNNLNDRNEMYEALEIVKAKLSINSKNIRLLCKIFNSINISIGQNSLIKEKLKQFYRFHLKMNYLVLNKGRFYPINRSDNYTLKFLKKIEVDSLIRLSILSKADWSRWGLGRSVKKSIAKFFSSADVSEANILYDIIEQCCCGSLEQQIKAEKIVNLLLFYGANPDIQVDSSKNTVLHCAIARHISGIASMEKIIKSLLIHGANPNLQNFLGYSSLHMAVSEHNSMKKIHPCRYSTKKIIEILLDYGADPNIKDKMGRTVLDRTRHKCILKLLKAHLEKKVE